VPQHLDLLGGFERVQHEPDRLLVHRAVLVGRPAHRAPPDIPEEASPKSGPSTLRNFWTPVNIRDFTVPRGTPVSAATSRWV
jgi:hypothetical protein